VPEAEFYLVRSIRPTSGPILKVLKERAREAIERELQEAEP